MFNGMMQFSTHLYHNAALIVICNKENMIDVDSIQLHLVD